MPIPSQTKVLPPRRAVNAAAATLRGSSEDALEDLPVLGHFHNYPPSALTGASFTAHEFMRYGLHRGWAPRVITDLAPDRTDVFEEIPVRRDANVRTITRDYRAARVVITHLNVTRKASEMGMRLGVPVVHLVHNPWQLGQYDVRPQRSALVIFNSMNVSIDTKWPGPSVVAYPLTPVERYRVPETGDAVTMVNLTSTKGAPLFFQLAKANPSVKFIGVKSTFGVQLKAPDLPNLEIWDPVEDMREVYAKTHLILMPSERETWGRVVVEAGASGIPSICSTAPGLVETQIGEQYLAPNDFEKWNKAVRRFTRGEKAWSEASEKAYGRAVELEVITRTQLDEACSLIEGIVGPTP